MNPLLARSIRRQALGGVGPARGTGVMIIVLTWPGWREGADPSLLYGRDGVADWCCGLRLAAGLAMLAASVAWLHAARKT